MLLLESLRNAEQPPGSRTHPRAQAVHYRLQGPAAPTGRILTSQKEQLYMSRTVLCHHWLWNCTTSHTTRKHSTRRCCITCGAAGDGGGGFGSSFQPALRAASARSSAGIAAQT